jgi:hypothetical protein
MTAYRPPLPFQIAPRLERRKDEILKLFYCCQDNPVFEHKSEFLLQKIPNYREVRLSIFLH